MWSLCRWKISCVDGDCSHGSCQFRVAELLVYTHPFPISFYCSFLYPACCCQRKLGFVVNSKRMTWSALLLDLDVDCYLESGDRIRYLSILWKMRGSGIGGVVRERLLAEIQKSHNDMACPSLSPPLYRKHTPPFPRCARSSLPSCNWYLFYVDDWLTDSPSLRTYVT